MAVGSNGKNKNPEDFNALEEYLHRFNEKPSTLTIKNNLGDYYDLSMVTKQLKKDFKHLKVLFTAQFQELSKDTTLNRRIIYQIQDGYILDMYNELAKNVFDNPKEDINKKEFTELIEINNLLCPNIDSNFYDIKVNEKIKKAFVNARIEYENIDVTIGMVSMEDGELCVEDFKLDNIEDMVMPDLHYGEGFEVFHLKLLEKLRNETKGLVLLHGQPGTGKCVTKDTKITIRNKITGELKKIDIKDLSKL